MAGEPSFLSPFHVSTIFGMKGEKQHLGWGGTHGKRQRGDSCTLLGVMNHLGKRRSPRDPGFIVGTVEHGRALGEDIQF